MKITSNTQPSITPTQNKTKNGFGVPDFDPNKPLDFLDDKGNAILDKLLDGRSKEDKTTIKVILNMTFHYLPSLKDGDQLHYVSNISTDPDSIKNTMQRFYDNNKNGGSDTIGLNNIVKDFLSTYTKETTSKQTQSTEEIKSKNLEQFYNKEIEQPAEKTKVVLEKKIPQHESRYDTLMKNYKNLSPAEHAEFSHLSVNRPLKSLSDEANKALAKSLEGKSDEEKSQIKAIISLELTTSIKMDKSGNILHGARDFSQQSKNDVTAKIQKFIDNFYKGGGTDTIGTIDVLKDFLSLYEQSNKTQENQKTTLKDLLKDKSA
jgi:hypothetical protein